MVFGSANADDAEIGKFLKAKGAEVKEIQGLVTAINDSGRLETDGRGFPEDDPAEPPENAFPEQRPERRAAGATDGPCRLEYLQTNLSQMSDEGIKPMAQLKNRKPEVLPSRQVVHRCRTWFTSRSCRTYKA